MRALIAGLILVSSVAGGIAQTSPVQMPPDDKNAHALHGLLTIYAAASVCEFKTWSFARKDTDEMLKRIKELGALVPKKVDADMWQKAREIMAEGEAMATQDRCAKVRDQYNIGRPFLLGLQPSQP